MATGKRRRLITAFGPGGESVRVCLRLYARRRLG
jgi:hypothetical protein